METPFLNWLESQDIGPRLAEAVTAGYNALVESSATAALAKYLNRPATVNVKASRRTGLKHPAYNYFTDAHVVNGVWAVHFTGLEAFEDIQESGFKNGTRTLDNLAYSANYSDSKRGKLGWLFALPLDCPYLDNYDLGYGDCGFLIKTDGVRARHIVDGDDEILFRGRDVLEKIPIIFDEDYDRWIAYPTDGKKLQNRSLRKLIQSVMKSLDRSEPARPPQEGLAALSESMTPGNLDLVRYFRNLGIEGKEDDRPLSFRDEENFWEPRPHFDRWIVHNTQAADRIYEEGFRCGMRLGKLANSWGSYDKPSDRIGGTVAFGTPLEDAKPLDEDFLWGSNWIDCGGSIVCKVSGVTAYHRDDREDQVMFDINSPKGCFWIRNTGFKSRCKGMFQMDDDSEDSGVPDSYEVIGKNPDRPLCKGTYDRCIRWCLDNGDAYSHMMKRWKSPGNTPKTESMMAEQSNALTEAGTNRQIMPLPEEFKNTVVEGLKYAIRYGFITRHATEYQDRHGDMWSYQKSHAIAMKLLDAIKGGNPDVAMIAGPYLMFEDGTVRYQAYATLDWKNVIKIISTNTIFPPANPPKFKVLTCFCCGDPNEANKWVKKLAASVGKTLEPTNENGTHRKSANDVARSRGKFIYSEIVKKLSDQYKTDIAPRVRELMQEICRPAEQRDMGKVAELSNKIREIYAGRNELVKQRDEYAWKLFHKRPTDAGERHFAPMSPEELENCVTELHDLNVEREGILNKLGMVKSKLAELQAVPEDEIDRVMLGSLLKEKQEITEQRFRVEEKVDACRDRLFGGREGNISFGK